MPAGISQCSTTDKARWKADRWRLPPYHYKSKFLMHRIDNKRVMIILSARERELLMFLGDGYTRACWNPTKSKHDLKGLEDAR